MMDTGVDVPEVVNLVFFKLVRSKTKFWQMVGRGTRLRPNLFGPGNDKTEFRIFDVCGNLEFFGSNPELSDPKVPKSLTERLIETRLKIARAIDDSSALGKDVPQGDTSLPSSDQEEMQEVRHSIVEEIRRFVLGLDVTSFVVRRHLREVEAWQAEAAPWSDLPEAAVEELTELAALPSSSNLGREEAKRFDLLMFELQLALLGRSTKLETCRNKLCEITTALSTKMEIPAVAQHAELVEEILSEGWWQGLTVPITERTRLRLRDIVHLIDQGSRTILYTDFEDELGTPTGVTINLAADFATFKKKAREFLSQHEDHLALRKLKSGKPLTRLDIEELERMLLEAGVGSDDEIAAARCTETAQVRGFGVFLRSLIGLDRGAVQAHFADFIEDGKTADQIEFVGMVIEHLTRSGVIDPGLLYDSPFTDRSPDGPDGVFDGAEVEDFLERVRAMNRTATVGAPAEVG